jgi:hypothetical protein
MARRTVFSCWKQYEKLALSYLGNGEDGTAIEKLQELTGKVNRDRIGSVLERFFVRPHVGLPIAIEFSVDERDGSRDWRTAYEADTGRILIHPVGIIKFRSEIRAIEVPDRDEDDLIHCRNLAFLSEIGKLSSVYFLFLMVLQRVAYLNEVAHLEKRGGIVEVAEGEAYHTLLWAFKELESFSKLTQGLNIRAEHNISWYESDWITGR